MGKGLTWTRTYTDEEGKFEIGGLVNRDYCLVLLRSGLAERQVVDSIAAGNGEAELIFAAATLSVSRAACSTHTDNQSQEFECARFAPLFRFPWRVRGR